MGIAAIIEQRMRTQRITGAPLATAAEAVRHLTCVQSQDAPLAAWSLAVRSEATTHSRVLEEQRAGGFLRTHILRPTWHYVAPEDLRWIQALTGPRVERLTAGRLRQLGISAERLDTCFARLGALLADGIQLTRAELTPHLEDLGDGTRGEVLTHLLMMAEVRCVIVSGRPREATATVAEHTYALADDVIPTSRNDTVDQDEAVRRLARRFFSAYGPATERDMARWSSLTLTSVRRAVADLTDELERIEIGDDILLAIPDEAPVRPSPPRSVLLSVFDPLVLSYPQHRLPRTADRLDRTRLIAESGGGVVIVGTTDVGLFKRTVTTDGVTVTVRPEAPLSGRSATAVRRAAGALAGFHERPGAVTITE